MPLTKEETKVLDRVQIMFTKHEDDYATAQAREGYKANAAKNADARKTAKKERGQRLGKVKQIRESSNVLLPTISLQEHAFETAHKENMGAKKRKFRSHMAGSRLHRKSVNARTVEEAGNVWEKKLADRMKGLDGQPEGCSKGDFQALSKFLKEDKADNRLLLPGQMPEGNLTQEQIGFCINQYMGLDFGMDLRTDETIAKESVRLEELSAKTQGLRHLIDGHPEMTAGLGEEEKQNLLAKLELGEQIADYYLIQKKVMTNDLYKTHYNSEITYKCRLEDTLEQRNLSLLLLQAEYMRNREEFIEDNTGRRWLAGYNEEIEPADEELEERARNLISQTSGALEYGKNNAGIEDSRHADYFREHNAEEDNMFRRMKREHYHVVGESGEMRESFVRHFANIPRLKAVQHMPREQLAQMMEDMTRTPVHMSDPEEVEACRRANLDGMRTYKELLKKQMNYLKRKYGNGYVLLSPEELLKYEADFENDFTNMQGMSFFVEYIKRLPGMFDKDDPEDQELDQWLDYYQTIAVSDGYSKNSYRLKTFNNFSAYKFGLMKSSLDAEVNVRRNLLKSADTLHLDVRWDTFFDENNVEFAEVLKCIERRPLSRMQEDMGTEHPAWQNLVPETQGMLHGSAIDYFIEKEYAIAQETYRFRSKEEGCRMAAGMMLRKVDQLRRESTCSARELYDQLFMDVTNWLQDHGALRTGG